MKDLSEEARLRSWGIQTDEQGGPIGPAIVSAADLQRRVFPPIRWIVPGLVPEGLTLLCGKPKLGKSWLAMDTGLAVSRGGHTLGRRCDMGAVLYLAMEDNERRLKARLERVAGNSKWPTEFQFATEWPRVDMGGLVQIEAWLDRSPNARLVIVDTLATVRPPSRSSDSVHGSDYAALRGLHAIANARGIGVVVVHHVRKADAEDPFDTVSGSTGLTGAADTTLILTRREAEGGTVLYGRGRDLEEVEQAVEFDAETCRWRDLGDPAEAFASDTRQAIFAAIRAGNQSPKQIAEFSGIDYELAKKTLQRMARAGDVRKGERGRYAIPSDPLSLRSLCPRQDDERDKGTEGTPPNAEFEERAAIREHDGEQTRAEAEAASQQEMTQ